MKNHALPSREALYADESCGVLNEALIEQTLKRFAVKYDIAEDQTGLFTPCHVRYNVQLIIDGEAFYNTEYQCNPSVREVRGEEVWNCVLTDAISYRNAEDLANFLDEYGYIGGGADSVRRGIKAYEVCKLTFEVLTKNGVDIDDALQFFTMLEDNGYDAEVETIEEHI